MSKPINLTNTALAIISANETTGLLFDNYNIVDFLIGGYGNRPAADWARNDQKLDLREIMAPFLGMSHGAGYGRFVEAGTDVSTWGPTDSTSFIFNAMKHNAINNLPRFVVANIGIALGGKLFKDIAAPRLNKALRTVPINQRGKKKGLSRYVKF